LKKEIKEVNKLLTIKPERTRVTVLGLFCDLDIKMLKRTAMIENIKAKSSTTR